jgi:hypothetical protein
LRSPEWTKHYCLIYNGDFGCFLIFFKWQFLMEKKHFNWEIWFSKNCHFWWRKNILTEKYDFLKIAIIDGEKTF